MTQAFRDYRDLEAWKAGMRLAKSVHRIVKHLPQEERFCLGPQMWRCAISVPSNIAEGWARGSGADFLRFLRIARGSLAELQTQCQLCVDVGYEIPAAEVQAQIEECQRILHGLMRSMDKG